MRLLLPLGRCGWRDKQEQAMAATDGKLQCAVGLAIPMEFGMPWYSHIILKDTTSRSWSSAWPDNMLCASTVTHWQITESLLEFVTLLDNKLTELRSGPGPWVFLIDVASVHIAYAFRSVLPKHTHQCCINRDSTSVAQSADIGSDETVQGRDGHCMRRFLCDDIARHPPCK